MPHIKKPKWDMSQFNINVGTKLPMPPSHYIDIGMIAKAEINKVTVEITIQKVSNNDVEGTISNIHSSLESIDDLSVGDYVYIHRDFIASINKDIIK